jgi:hypothetical protein
MEPGADELEGVLLWHPSISQNQQAVAALQQTSQQLQAAVAQWLPGALPVTLHVTRRNQAQSFGLWLRKHGGLLQQLAVHVAGSEASKPTITYDRTWPISLGLPASARPQPYSRLQDITVTELAHTLQQAAASGPLQLQSFLLTGATASSLWHYLPAATLTSLCVQVWDVESENLQAVAALSGLRSLQLSSSRPSSSATPTALQALTGWQQLTQLSVSPISPQQLQYLPPQLHLTVVLNYMHPQSKAVEAVKQFADWLQCNINTVRSLKVVGPSSIPKTAEWEEASAAFAAAFEEAASPMQLASFSSSWDSFVMTHMMVQVVGLQGVLQHMPASTLTQLTCTAEWQHELPAHFNAAVAGADCAAVCGLTGLRSLTLGHHNVGFKQDALGPLTVLQDLTSLRLEIVSRQQLGLLQMPQLRELYVGLYAHDSSTAQLQLGHLSSVSRLWVLDRGLCGRLQPSEQLPPNVVDVWWHHQYTYGNTIQLAGGAWSVQRAAQLLAQAAAALEHAVRRARECISSRITTTRSRPGTVEQFKQPARSGARV